MNKRIIIAAGLMAALALTGCTAANGDGSENDAEAGADKQSTETVTLSTGTQFPPMGYIDNGKLIGFDIDLGNAIAERAGVTIEWSESIFNQFLSDVNSGRTDGIMGAILDTPERQESLTWVDYLQSGFQFYTLQDTATELGIKKAEDLCGYTVAASRNSSYAASINEWSAKNCGGNNITVLDTDGSPDSLLQLRQGRAQAAMQTSETIAYQATNDETIVPLGEAITTSYYGIAFANDNPDMTERFTAALEELIADGTYEKIAAEWGLEKQAIDRVSINLEGR